MKRPKITAGNWHVGTKEASPTIYNERGDYVAESSTVMLMPDEANANTRAIAAVPRMLTGQENTLTFLESWARSQEKPDAATFHNFRRFCQMEADNIKAALTAAGYEF